MEKLSAEKKKKTSDVKTSTFSFVVATEYHAALKRLGAGQKGDFEHP